MLVKFNQSDKLPGTVVIADLAERRAREVLNDDHHSQEPLDPGTKLGRYIVIEKLGGGGMGVVYKAQDTQLHRTVALKVLPPPLCQQPEYLQRFHSEAQAHARLNHPQVMTLYSSFEVATGAVLVMEHVDGQTLEQHIKRGGPLSAAEAIRIFDLVLRGVEHLHSQGVVHRDLKPGNIFLTRDGQVKLIDFGVAKLMDHSDRNAQRTMVGTLLYISPEQINGYATDFRSDIYTLGVTLFEAVTGRLPFERRSDYALLHAHVQERPPRPTTLRRQIPLGLEWAILKAIEKDPGRRFQSAAEFRRMLLKLGLVERRKETATPDFIPAPESAITRRMLGGLCLDTALIAAVIGLVYTLGIYPSDTSTQTAKAMASKPVATVTTPAAAKPITAQTKSVATPSKKDAPAQTGKILVASSTTGKMGDKYNALRTAWSE